MAVQNRFGGKWTIEKLDRLRKYLEAYTRIFKKNKAARFFTTTYFDAFAGAGSFYKKTNNKDEAGLFNGFGEGEALEFRKGSAQIALEVKPGFDRYFFVEKSKNRVEELNNLKKQYPDKSENILIVRGEANDVLRKWCEETDWNKNRGVVFLDPYGMQVEWQTVEAVATTKAIDLWLLFPLGMGVGRLLTRGGFPPAEFSNRLTLFLGTDEWKQHFYHKELQTDLFGEINTEIIKDADFEKIGKYFTSRLKTIFSEVSGKPLPLRNSRGHPMYLLFFAAGNPRGSKTAIRIANYLLK